MWCPTKEDNVLFSTTYYFRATAKALAMTEYGISLAMTHITSLFRSAKRRGNSYTMVIMEVYAQKKEGEPSFLPYIL